MNNILNKYIYEGPIQGFDGSLRTANWSGVTMAVTERKALANLSFQYRREKGLTRDSKVILIPKYLIKIEKTKNNGDGYIYYDEEMRRMINESI